MAKTAILRQSKMNTQPQQLQNPRLKRRRPSTTPSNNRHLQPQIMLITFLLYSLLLLVTRAQTHREPLIIGTVDEGGDVLLRRRSASTLDNEGGDGSSEQQWVVYDFKPAIPPYSVGQMEELLLIPRQRADTDNDEIVDEEKGEEVVDNNNATIEEEEEAAVVINETSSEEGDLDVDSKIEEKTIIADDQDGDDVESTSSEIDDTAGNTADAPHVDSKEEEKAAEETATEEEEVTEGEVIEDDKVADDVVDDDATDDTTDNIMDDEDNNDVVEVVENELEEEEAPKMTQMGDTDASLSDSSDEATLDKESNNEETENIDEGSPDSEEERHDDNDNDMVPAVESHNTAAPPTGPLPEPDTDDDDVDLDESSKEEQEPLVESESEIESSEEDDEEVGEEVDTEVDEENETMQQQTTVEDATDGNMDHSTGANDEDNDPTVIVATKEDEDGGVQQEVEVEDDTNDVIVDDNEAPIVINEDSPSPEAIESSPESSPDTETTADEEQIKIQYDDPLPPTSSSSPPSSNNKDANREFVTGLDDVDKLFESVEVPDELDVGADGSSMQDVLVGQALKIITKKAKSLGGAIKVKFDKIATPVKKALPQLGLFGGDNDNEDEAEIDALFASLVNGNENMAKPNLQEEEEHALSELNEKLKKLKQKVKDLPLFKSEEAQK
eukprot:scaffold1463_cov101-Skeletonema_dohrnii-CCMP3373.AAC.4